MHVILKDAAMWSDWGKHVNLMTNILIHSVNEWHHFFNIVAWKHRAYVSAKTTLSTILHGCMYMLLLQIRAMSFEATICCMHIILPHGCCLTNSIPLLVSLTYQYHTIWCLHSMLLLCTFYTVHCTEFCCHLLMYLLTGGQHICNRWSKMTLVCVISLTKKQFKISSKDLVQWLHIIMLYRIYLQSEQPATGQTIQYQGRLLFLLLPSQRRPYEPCFQFFLNQKLP